MTKVERLWQDALRRLGCIVCYLFLHAAGVPPQIHHILSGGRKIGEAFTLPLCRHHHQGGVEGESRHPYRKAFEARFGSEWSLWGKCRQLVVELGLMREAPAVERPAYTLHSRGDGHDVEREDRGAEGSQARADAAAGGGDRGAGEAGAVASPEPAAGR